MSFDRVRKPTGYLGKYASLRENKVFGGMEKLPKSLRPKFCILLDSFRIFVKF